MNERDVLKPYVSHGYELMMSLAKHEDVKLGSFVHELNELVLDNMNEEEQFYYKCLLLSEALRGIAEAGKKQTEYTEDEEETEEGFDF
ncbi:hypothetical protein [Listeria valentina]|uniref:hypothetical protein n=1 Tax=Listeria valentina TaxID=2705293 RepID=UPI0014322705|nr:hypothetical protein [Listeria valentina]